MLKLSDLIDIGVDGWSRPTFKSSSGRFYCTVEFNMTLQDVADGRAKLYTKGDDPDGEPGWAVQFENDLHTDPPMKCDQCQWARINGVFCHEIGCPNSGKKWMGDRGWVRVVECSNCGCDIEQGDRCDCTDQQEEEP
jgi:hypothetical protein